MIHTDGKPTIAHRGSLPDEVNVINTKKDAKRRKFQTLATQREIDREIARLVAMKVVA